jgi:Ca-activated chloride channel homolog
LQKEETMFFEYPAAFVLLFLLPFLWFVPTKKQTLQKYFSPVMYQRIFAPSQAVRLRFWLFITVFFLLVVAAARPQRLHLSAAATNKSIPVVVALDMSRSMKCGDVYPTRLAFAKQKLLEFISHARALNIAVVGFSDAAFLISPLTEDTTALQYLLTHIDKSQVRMRSTNIMSVLRAVSLLLAKQKERCVVLFTDGSSQTSFSKEIKYAKKHRISVFVYGVGTTRGAAIKDANGWVRDRHGNIVITRRNDAIARLCHQTGGSFLPMSTERSDMQALANRVQKTYFKKNDSGGAQKEELFFFPLAAALLLFVIASTGFLR